MTDVEQTASVEHAAARLGWRVALVASLLGATGCGTAFSRGQGTAFWAFPFQAVVVDGYLISKTLDAPEEFMGMIAPGPLFLVWGLVSLPFDLALDAVALPVDLGAWILGHSKQRAGPRAERE